MKTKALLAALAKFDPEAEVVIETWQCKDGWKIDASRVRMMTEKECDEHGISYPRVVIE